MTQLPLSAHHDDPERQATHDRLIHRLQASGCTCDPAPHVVRTWWGIAGPHFELRHDRTCTFAGVTAR
jgi:hypothetical protein